MISKQFAIVGGGIGGLTLAIALQKKGFKVKVFEKAPDIKPLGAGLVLAANAINAFKNIGIDADIIAAGKLLKALYVKDLKGNILTSTNSERISKKFGAINNFTIHRADLHSVLFCKLAQETVILDKGCVDFKQGANGTTLFFSDGSSYDADYVIACDGIHSPIRRKLLPDTLPRYAGYTCFRGVVDQVPHEVSMDETSESWGPGRRFGIVPLSNNRVYWFACINAAANDSKFKNYKSEDLLSTFGDFHDPVKQIIAGTPDDKLIWSDIIDLKPLKKYAFGNILLMGDAAHATTPNMGQGACMAIEDAAILANCLTQTEIVEEAFQLFEKKRIKRTTTIVNNSWRIGKMAQIENRGVIAIRNLIVKLTPDSVAERQIKFLTDVSYH